jgi:hypothetical protein
VRSSQNPKDHKTKAWIQKSSKFRSIRVHSCKKIKILPSAFYRNIGIANFGHAHSHFGRYPD